MNSETSFIETQFPVSKVSKESYKERMSNYSQTLTGLGKWWGRKPLVLVRATILGLLLPSTDNPEKDREIFLKLMTMDEEGLWLRKEKSGKSISAGQIVEILTDEDHESRVKKKITQFESLDVLVHDLGTALRQFISEKDGRYSWIKKTDPRIKLDLEKLAFQSLYYDEKLDFCVRPEHIENISEDAWKVVNAHLKTNAKSLPELVEELGIRKFGHRPKVGDAFCGGGSIPFEAARMGCDVYASDLNPVAALLTWAALNIIGGGPEVAEQVKKAQEEIYYAVDAQVTEWGIEHNGWGHRADAYLYCVEVLDPETGWMVPLAPSWVIGEKTRTVAILEPDKANKRYNIKIKMGATDAEMKKAKSGTTEKGYVKHPQNPNPVPMSLIRRENAGGLRLWENEDIIPRTEDVFQERLYCIRYVNPSWETKWKDLLILAKSHPDKTFFLWKISGEWAHDIGHKELRDLPVSLSGNILLEISKALHQHEKDAMKILYSTLRKPDSCKKDGESLVFSAKFSSVECTIGATPSLKSLTLHSCEVKTSGAVLFSPERVAPTKAKAKKKAEETNHILLTTTEPDYLEPEDDEFRYYTSPTKEDLEREDKALSLIQERFSDWQQKGFIPSRKIEAGEETSRLMRERGWTHWHQLFNARQLLVNGSFMEKGKSLSTISMPFHLVAIQYVIMFNCRLSVYRTQAGNEARTESIFLNQAINTLFNYGSRPLTRLDTTYLLTLSFADSQISLNSLINTINAIEINFNSDIWITDPPYADAVNYHELSEFFLSWYEKHIPKLFPDWYTDSKRALAIKGEGGDFRRSMIEAYKNLAKNMPENGMQVVMFTHQDVGVWADLALILWASGLKVTTAWTIATETDNIMKEGNYVQGTVLLVLRKNTSDDSAFLDELIPEIEDEVKRQIDSMSKLEDKEEPNFGDTDYQLASYAAALRVLTKYKTLGDIDIERELSRTRTRGESASPLEVVIENAKAVASGYLIPEGVSKDLWNDLSAEERYYLKALDLESKSENKAGIYQELARSYGIREYEPLMSSLRANASRPKTAVEFGSNLLSGEGFSGTLTRSVLYAICSAIEAGSANQGRFYLQTERKDYWARRLQIVSILRYLSRFGVSLEHWKKQSEMANILASLVENDRS